MSLKNKYWRFLFCFFLAREQSYIRGIAIKTLSTNWGDPKNVAKNVWPPSNMWKKCLTPHWAGEKNVWPPSFIKMSLKIIIMN